MREKQLAASYVAMPRSESLPEMREARLSAVPPPRPSLLETEVWDEELLAAAGVGVADAHFVTVGGGLGSFAVVDFLRIAGVPASRITVLSNASTPHETFAKLVSSSQMKPEDRLRSDSSSMIDNIWGWPGYALIEAWKERSLTPLWKVVTEPLLSEYFTPRVRTVIDAVRREAARIEWESMLVRCWAEVVRRRAGGGYFVLVRMLEDQRRVAYRCQHVHLALGHGGPRLLPELLSFRERHRGARCAMNAYEPHEHVYEQLVRAPGRVVLRGSGITASRVLERLIHDREALGARTGIIHLFRRYVEHPVGPPLFRRPAGDGFMYQPFNFPKAAGGGQLRQRMLAMSREERARLTELCGGTTTALRSAWQRPLARARREGWYRAVTGVLTGIGIEPTGKLRLAVTTEGSAEAFIASDFLIDATGLDETIERHPLLADLLAWGDVSLNPVRRLEVEPSFELPGMRSGAGRMYATGAATLGGALAPVDSFWGLTHAAMEIVDDLADQGMCAFPGPLRSTMQWWRWMRNQRP